MTCVAVHPRRRGEHVPHACTAGTGDGSSPQARGTHPDWHPRQVCIGSSPQARGTLVAWDATEDPASVHPRRRGEHLSRGTRPRILIGSLFAQGVSRRFIPAGAGNTQNRRSLRPCRSVHPRRRGEHPGLRRKFGVKNGSSPQARGTRLRSADLRGAKRFIPAGAGNTYIIGSDGGSVSVHPRRRGEHRGNDDFVGVYIGSSPQARGTRVTMPDAPGVMRFIPAGAGNTCNSDSYSA